MPRITSHKTRQAVVSTESAWDPNLPPERLTLFDEDGTKFDLVDILERLLAVEAGGGGGASLMESWKGEWSYESSYQPGDLVRFYEMVWMAKEAIPEDGNSPGPGSDIWELIAGQDVVGLPPGGTYAQVLAKASDNGYDVAWTEPLTPIPSWTADTYPVGSLVRYFDTFWVAVSEAGPLDEPGLVGVFRLDPDGYSSTQIGSGAYAYTVYGNTPQVARRYFFTVTTAGTFALSNAAGSHIKVYRPDETVLDEGSDTDFELTADQLGDYFIVLTSGVDNVVRSGSINLTELTGVAEPEPPQTSPWETYTQDSVADTGEVLQGPQGEQGPQGPQGPAGADGDDGVGIPAGGTDGQVLTKASATDFDTAWEDPPAGGGGGAGAQTFTVEALAEIGPFDLGDIFFGPELEFEVGSSGAVLIYAQMEFKQPPSSSTPTFFIDGVNIYDTTLPTYGNTSYHFYTAWWEGLLVASRTNVKAAIPGLLMYLTPGTHTGQWGLRNNPGGGYAQKIRLAALVL